MTPCRWPGCFRPSEAVVRIDLVGDRATCAVHLRWMDENAMGYRRLDAVSEPLPEWRRRGITARVLDHGHVA